jgi:hypothetical protein
MPRITSEYNLQRAMVKLQSIFLEQQNTDVSVSRAKFNDWADSVGNKTLLFQSLYTKGIPINELAKWLSPTANQGQVRNAVVKISDISYVRGIMGALGTVESFKKILKQGDNSTSIANAYTGSIRYWWSNQSGNETSRTRTPRATRTTRTTTPSEPTTTNGGTTEITEGVLSSIYQIIKSYHNGIQWWLGNSMLTDPVELRVSWMRYLNQGLLSQNYALLVNPATTEISRNLLFWSSQNEQTKVMLQRMALILLFDFNNFTRLATTSILETPNNFTEEFFARFGRQNTYTALSRALEIKHPSFAERIKFVSREDSLLQKIYRGRNSSSARTTTTSTSTATTTASATAATGRIRDTEFNNTFGVEIEYWYAPREKIISECRKIGVGVNYEGYTHAITTYWKLVTDGSVRGTNGLEFVSPILRGRKGLVTLRNVLQACAKAGMLANNTAGVHIHFGAKDWTLQTWKNLLINYQGFQKIIDSYCTSYRREGQENEAGDLPTYIEPTGNISNWRQKVDNATSFRELQLMFLRHKNMPTDGSINENRERNRYFNVNLFAYPKQGTVEFRQLGSSIEFEMIANWILFLNYLIAVSERKVLTNFSFEGLLNILPQNVGTYWHNRIFDLNTPFNKAPLPLYTPYEDRS